MIKIKSAGILGGKSMLPTAEEAQKILREAEECNPGPWGEHSRIAARCAERVARACRELDPERAYLSGLLHDIGRKFGTGHMRHIYDGYQYMMELGYDEIARICLTHSFSLQKIEDYIGRHDVTEEELRELTEALADIVYDDYDRLIQLCDSIAGGESIMDIEERMADVKRRYGDYPQDKWERNLELKSYFEKKMGKDLYEVVGKTCPTADLVL